MSGDIAWLGPEPAPAFLSSLHAGLGTIAFPGLINSHDHLEFNCYAPTGKPPYRDFLEWSRDVQAQTQAIAAVETISPATRRKFGLLKNLLWGVTAVADHGGKPMPDSPLQILARYAAPHSPELAGRFSLLGLGTVVAHMAEGVSPESRERALAFLDRNWLKRPIAAVHGVSLEQQDFARLAALIWCPASNDFLFGRTADVGHAACPILFGTDSTLSAPGTLWDHLRLVRGLLPDAEILAALTDRAARFWNIRNDGLVLARRKAHDLWDSFFTLTPDDILLVRRGGTTLLQDASLGRPQGEFALLPGAQKYVALPLLAMAAASGLAQFETLVARYRGLTHG